MPMLDIFGADAFSLVPLTDAINKLKFAPGRIGQMGLFQEQGISATSVAIEEKDGILSLISPSARGGPGTTLDKSKRKLHTLPVPHFEVNDAIMAEEVQGVRAWGSETELETVMGKVAERMAILSQSLEVTQEHARVGAIKGVVTYADASELDLFAEFGVSQLTEVDFDLDNANPAKGAVRKKCASVTRSMAGQLDGVPFTGIGGICGDAFFDDLIAHSEVRETYLSQVQASELREAYVAGGQSYGSFTFGGITFENYRGSLGGSAWVETDKCHFYPIGVPGLFRTYYAPADYEETVNTIGRRLTAKQYPFANDKGRHLDVQMNALNICTRPSALIKAKRT